MNIVACFLFTEMRILEFSVFPKIYGIFHKLEFRMRLDHLLGFQTKNNKRIFEKNWKIAAQTDEDSRQDKRRKRWNSQIHFSVTLQYFYTRNKRMEK